MIIVYYSPIEVPLSAEMITSIYMKYLYNWISCLLLQFAKEENIIIVK